MESLLVRCIFCGTRHLLDREEVESWFMKCSCGAYGFTESETEFATDDFRGVGFTVHEVSNSVGTVVHLSDPLPVIIDETNNWIYVFWYKEVEGIYV